MTSPGSSGEIDTWLSSLEADLAQREQKLGLIEKGLEGAAVPQNNGGPDEESKLQTGSVSISAQSTARRKHSIYEGFKQHDALMSTLRARCNACSKAVQLCAAPPCSSALADRPTAIIERASANRSCAFNLCHDGRQFRCSSPGWLQAAQWQAVCVRPPT